MAAIVLVSGGHLVLEVTGATLLQRVTTDAVRGRAVGLMMTVDTGADPKFRVVGFSTSWASYGSHTIKLVVVGTSGRPRVDLDAFEIVR